MMILLQTDKTPMSQNNFKNIRPVLLCGGMGKRLYPLSTPQKPKPFLQLTSSKYSLFQQTLLRIEEFKAPAILCNKDHIHLVRRELDELTIQPDSIMKEPISKNTGPAAALAAKYYSQKPNQEMLLFLPCDHHIEDIIQFKKALSEAYEHAQKGNVVLFGETPLMPETGYGYIQAKSESKIADILKFHEKPDLETATRYINQGAFWNTGIVMVESSKLMQLYKSLAPDIFNILDQINPENISQDIYDLFPDISIDCAILEHANDLKMQPVSIGWSDIGTIDRLKALA